MEAQKLQGIEHQAGNVLYTIHTFYFRYHFIQIIRAFNENNFFHESPSNLDRITSRSSILRVAKA